MKVTPQLINWLHSKYIERKYTYADLGKAAEPSWQAWQQLLTHKTHQITEKMQTAICDVFNINKHQLIQIVETGHLVPQKDLRRAAENQPHNIDQHDRLANWLRSDATPAAAEAVHATAKALGFKDCHSVEKTCPRLSNDCPGLKKKYDVA